MGSSISIDKHVSNLDELLEKQPSSFANLQFESKVPEGVTQHLQIWRFYEDHKKVDMIKTLPVHLGKLATSGFSFSSEESYLILLIYKSEAEERCELVNFPHSLCGVVESVSNLTPRGLLNTFSSTNESVNEPPINSERIVESLESLLISKREEKNTKYKHMLFLWNGKNSNGLVKALAMTKGYELDALLHAAKDPLLHFLFSGGVVQHKKLQCGPVLLFTDVVSAFPKEDNDSGTLKKACKTVFLLQWWLPQHGKESESVRSEKHVLKYPRFTHTILTSAPKDKTDYFSRFEEVDDSSEEENEEADENKGEKAKKKETFKVSIGLRKLPAEEDKDDIEAKGEPGYGSNRKNVLSFPMKQLENQYEELERLPRDKNKVFEDTKARPTTRKEILNEMCGTACTEIIEDVLYMGSDMVAQNKALLQANKITHIVNSAADYCDCYFPSDFKYKCYHLKDTLQEDIECCFYNTIDFIREAKAEGGRVFIHCIQGISRSATLCLAYMIFDKGLTHQEAFARMQKQRPIANPNMIFNVQLIWWHMRLYQDYSALPISPRVFAVSSHQKEQPMFIVARLVSVALRVADGALV